MYALSTTEVHQGQQTADLHSATQAADALAREAGVEVKVVHLATSAVVYATSAKALQVAQGGQFDPWTRLEVPKFAAPDFNGWVPAYTRKRIQATVYRKNDYTRGGTNWRVFDGRTGNFEDVSDTKAACALTSAMRHGHMI